MKYPKFVISPIDNSMFIKFMEINTEELVLNIVKTKEIRGMNFVQILCEILANSTDDQMSIKIVK